MMTSRFLNIIAAAGLALSIATAARAAEKIDFILNWVPGGDHSPYFYALEKGLYAEAGLDVSIQPGKGSGMSSQRVGLGKNQLGIADLATALVAKSKGANLVAVMNVYANSPYAIYWLKSSGIAGPKDFAGNKLGNPPWDAARVMWPALAKAIGIPATSVSFVNVAPQAKLSALKSGAIQLTTDFYNGHDLKIRELGDDMGFMAWKEVGINPYGNSIIANGDYLKSNRKAVAAFTAVTQKAFAACVADERPCLDALMRASSGLKLDVQVDQWKRVEELMTDKFTTSVALGYFDPGRVADDYKMVETYFKMEKPFDVGGAFTNEFLDRGIKMPK
ncbi:MAG: ABC transporter substrate-binding protein [Alphaproteobacteria bacterium]|jgi:NitT/TauT family transport system substrate-binding protein|nr:ABC transporter substrate-binding protein [Alphaproteobacteria bacterium]MDP6813150.1 ABC transporter substrate-binding protein [Alphaproteobacteria bacterium]